MSALRLGKSGLSLTAVGYVLASICNAVVEQQPHKENLKRMLLALDGEEGSRERQGTLRHNSKFDFGIRLA